MQMSNEEIRSRYRKADDKGEGPNGITTILSQLNACSKDTIKEIVREIGPVVHEIEPKPSIKWKPETPAPEIPHTFDMKADTHLISETTVSSGRLAPFGLHPHSEWLHERYDEIMDAISRYRQVEMEVPYEWLREAYELTDRIRMAETEAMHIQY